MNFRCAHCEEIAEREKRKGYNAQLYQHLKNHHGLTAQDAYEITIAVSHEMHLQFTIKKYRELFT